MFICLLINECTYIYSRDIRARRKEMDPHKSSSAAAASGFSSVPAGHGSATGTTTRLSLVQQLISDDMITLCLGPLGDKINNVDQNDLKKYIQGNADAFPVFPGGVNNGLLRKAKLLVTVAKCLANDITACDEYPKNNLKKYLLVKDENGEKAAEKKAKLWKEEGDFKAIGEVDSEDVRTTLEFLVKNLCSNEEIGSSSGEC